MTPAYKRQLTRYKKLVAERAAAINAVHTKYNARIDVLKTALKDGCVHPGEFVEEYRWMHDSGYGRQSWVTGLYCRLCGRKKSWKDMGLWHDPETSRRNDD